MIILEGAFGLAAGISLPLLQSRIPSKAAKLILGSFNLPVLAEESRTAQEFLAAMTMHLAQCIKDPTSIKDHMVDLAFILGQTA